MFKRDKVIPREGLQFASDQFVEAHDHNKAIAILQETTGVRDLASLPNHQAVVATAVLVSRLTVDPSKTVARPRSRRLGEIHARPKEMAASILWPEGVAWR